MSALLRTLLLIVFAANLAGLVNYVFNRRQLSAAFAELGSLHLVLLVLFEVVALVGLLLVWSWRRSGLWLFLAAYAALLWINLDFGADPAQVAMLPLGAAVVVGVVWAQRSRYRPRP